MFEFQFGDNALVVISVDIYAMVGVVAKVLVGVDVYDMVGIMPFLGNRWPDNRRSDKRRYKTLKKCDLI